MMFGVYLLLLLAPAAAPVPSADVTIDKLAADLQQWKKEARFFSTYRLRQGYAKSVDAALRDGADASIKEPAHGVFQGSGVYHKKGDLALQQSTQRQASLHKAAVREMSEGSVNLDDLTPVQVRILGRGVFRGIDFLIGNGLP